MFFTFFGGSDLVEKDSLPFFFFNHQKQAISEIPYISVEGWSQNVWIGRAVLVFNPGSADLYRYYWVEEKQVVHGCMFNP